MKKIATYLSERDYIENRYSKRQIVRSPIK